MSKLRDYSHQLDPTRKAAMGGVQRNSLDQLSVCDVAGYNGDGGKITNTWMPNMVSEYGSYTSDRPGAYDPTYGGFGTAPKFPQTDAIALLVEQSAVKGEPTSTPDASLWWLDGHARRLRGR